MRHIKLSDVTNRRCPSPGYHADGFRVFTVNRTSLFQKDKLGLPDVGEMLAIGGDVWEVVQAWAPEDGVMEFSATPSPLRPREHHGVGSIDCSGRTPQK